MSGHALRRDRSSSSLLALLESERDATPCGVCTAPVDPEVNLCDACDRVLRLERLPRYRSCGGCGRRTDHSSSCPVVGRG